MPLLLSLLACVAGDPSPGALRPTYDGPPPSGSVVDSYLIGDPKVPADVIVAVDPDVDSQTMLEEEVLPSLIEALDMIDPSWRVAVTSTALGDLVETGYLAPAGADGGRWLSHEDLAHLAIDWADFPDAAPSGGTGATYLTVNADPDGFLRPDATLYLVLLSHADSTPDAIVTFDDWVLWVSDQGAIVSARTAVGTPLADVVAGSGGAVVDPWGEVDSWASKIGLLSWGVPSSYRLSRLPIQGTVTLSVEDPSGATFEFFEAVGDPPVGDWVYRETPNSVEFLSFVPEAGETVVVSYLPRGG